MVIVSVHQQFHALLKLLAKVLASDVYVAYDSVQFTRQEFHARQLLKSRAGNPEWLTVPVLSTGTRQILNNVRVAENGWRRRHLDFLEANYHQAPCFGEVFPLIHAVYGRQHQFLVEHNLDLLEQFCRYLAPVSGSSEPPGSSTAARGKNGCWIWSETPEATAISPAPPPPTSSTGQGSRRRASPSTTSSSTTPHIRRAPDRSPRTLPPPTCSSTPGPWHGNCWTPAAAANCAPARNRHHEPPRNGPEPDQATRPTGQPAPGPGHGHGTDLPGPVRPRGHGLTVLILLGVVLAAVSWFGPGLL
uniref:WbqC family protein n=1 Tax=Arthrobacter sp. Hiyo1 TaxID=1588020 RepID=UPI001C0EA60D